MTGETKKEKRRETMRRLPFIVFVVLIVAALFGLAIANFAQTGAIAYGAETGVTAYENSGVTVTSNTQEVNLASGEENFHVRFALTNPGNFAGAEFALRCADGVTVEKVSYDTPSSKAGPTPSKGVTWFGFFGGENDFSGTVTATVDLKYTGTENTTAVLDLVQVHTKSGTRVQSGSIPANIMITINRAGQTNKPALPATPPAHEGPGMGEIPIISNPASEGTSSNIAGTDKGTNKSGTQSVQADISSSSSASSAPATRTESVSPELRQIDGGNVPASAGAGTDTESNNTILGQTENGTALTMGIGQGNTLLWILLVVCVCVIVILGCLLIVRRREQKLKSE
ncbi:hypothetical protein AGMMS49983_16860 [Clostridia bacterium]|nr:hypothetical protein AGMMS49983_16860 [Clostridia bacterium]